MDGDGAVPGQQPTLHVGVGVGVFEVKARTVPTKVEPTPSVADLPTCQKTLQACAPLTSAALLLGAVMSVEPAWKVKTAFGSPSAFERQRSGDHK